jgi:hypothetical protein
MTYAIGQPMRLTKSVSVQAKRGVALPSGALGAVVQIAGLPILPVLAGLRAARWLGC